VVVVHFYLNDIPSQVTFKKQYRELANKDESAAKKQINNTRSEI